METKPFYLDVLVKDSDVNVACLKASPTLKSVVSDTALSNNEQTLTQACGYETRKSEPISGVLCTPRSPA